MRDCSPFKPCGVLQVQRDISRSKGSCACIQTPLSKTTEAGDLSECLHARASSWNCAQMSILIFQSLTMLRALTETTCQADGRGRALLLHCLQLFISTHRCGILSQHLVPSQCFMIHAGDLNMTALQIVAAVWACQFSGKPKEASETPLDARHQARPVMSLHANVEACSDFR